MQQSSNTRRTIHALAQASAILGIALATLSAGAQQRSEHPEASHFFPGNLVVSRSVYDNNPANVKVGTILPPNCAATGWLWRIYRRARKRPLSLRLQ